MTRTSADALAPLLSTPLRLAASLAAAGVCLLAYLTTFSGHLLAPDDEIQFRTLEALARRQWTAIKPLDQGFATRRGPDGEEYSQYGVGLPLAALPFYDLGVWLDDVIPDRAIAGMFWPTTQYHDGSPSAWKRRLGASLFNSFVTAALVGVFCWTILGWGLSAKAGFAAALLLGLGTYAWAHARTFFSEPLAALLAFAAFGLIASWRDRGLKGWARPLAAGLLAGFGFLVRKDQPLFFPGLCLCAALPLFEDAAGRPLSAFRRERLGSVIRGSACVLAGMLAMMAAHFGVAWAQWGDPGALGYEDQAEGVAFGAPLYSGIYGFLFSYGRGMFFFSPALILALWGWPRLWRNRPMDALGAALVVLPFFLMMCRWQNWAGGWSWGPRHICQLHVFLALGLAGFWMPERAPTSSPAPEPNARRRVWAWAGLFLGAMMVAWSGPSLAGNVAGGLLLAAGAGGLLAGYLSPKKDEQKASRGAPISPDRWIVAGFFLLLGAGVQVYACSQSFIDYYMLYFRLPEAPPSSRALYAPGEAAGYLVTVELPGLPSGPPAPLWARSVPAPIMDSVYVPHNSAWIGYAEMAREGFHDLFWRRQLGLDDLPPAAISLEVYRPGAGADR